MIVVKICALPAKQRRHIFLIMQQVRESLPHKKPPPIPWEGLVVRPGTYRVGVSEEGIPGQLSRAYTLWRDNGHAGRCVQIFRSNGVFFVSERHKQAVVPENEQWPGSCSAGNFTHQGHGLRSSSIAGFRSRDAPGQDPVTGLEGVEISSGANNCFSRYNSIHCYGT